MLLVPNLLLGVAAGAAALVAYAVWWFKHADCDGTVARAERRYIGAIASRPWAGKVVLITGASSGIGEALAHEFAKGGATLILAARRADRLRSVAEACMSLGASLAVPQVLDITDFASHARVVDALVKTHGRIDVLVNNAGASQRGLCESTPVTIDRDILELNFFAPMALTKAVLPHMLRQAEAGAKAHIVNTCSVAGKTGSPISASYAAAKAALTSWADSLRMEVASRGVSVMNAIPGPVMSEITLHAFTEKPGTKLGTAADDNAHRVTAERCARLMVAGLWGGLHEVWISKQPVLLFLYVGQYFPSLYAYLAPKAGAKRVAAFKAGITGYQAFASVGGILQAKGAGGKSE